MSDLPPTPLLNIAETARETGLGKDSLRAWERRYGFPTPSRDAQGERLYTQEQVDRLRTIRRLLLSGLRPGKVVGLAPPALQALVADTASRPSTAASRHRRASKPLAEVAGPVDSAKPVDPAGEPDGAVLDEALAALARGDVAGLRRLLSQSQARQGLGSFVTRVAAPLATRIGQAWVDGSLQVYQEHLGIELLAKALRQAMLALPEAAPQARPRVLLTTLPGEPHGLGLLMAEAMLALEGCDCIALGVQTPLGEIAAAARHCQADVVALSAAGSLTPRRFAGQVAQLRASLPADVALWLGGHGACFPAPFPVGVEVFSDLLSIAPAVQAWRAVTGSTSNAA